MVRHRRRTPPRPRPGWHLRTAARGWRRRIVKQDGYNKCSNESGYVQPYSDIYPLDVWPNYESYFSSGSTESELEIFVSSNELTPSSYALTVLFTLDNCDTNGIDGGTCRLVLSSFDLSMGRTTFDGYEVSAVRLNLNARVDAWVDFAPCDFWDGCVGTFEFSEDDDNALGTNLFWTQENLAEEWRDAAALHFRAMSDPERREPADFEREFEVAFGESLDAVWPVFAEEPRCTYDFWYCDPREVVEVFEESLEIDGFECNDPAVMGFSASLNPDATSGLDPYRIVHLHVSTERRYQIESRNTGSSWFARCDCLPTKSKDFFIFEPGTYAFVVYNSPSEEGDWGPPYLSVTPIEEPPADPVRD